MPSVLAEVVGGVNQHTAWWDAVIHCAFGGRGDLCDYVLDNVAVAGSVGVGSWSKAAGVGADVSGAELASYTDQLWVCACPGVIEKVGAGFARHLPDLMAPRVDADDEVGVLLACPFHGGDDPIDLLVGADVVTGLASFDAADVDDVGAVVNALIDSAFGVIELEGGATVVEGVGGAVNDPHDQRPVAADPASAELEFEPHVPDPASSVDALAAHIGVGPPRNGPAPHLSRVGLWSGRHGQWLSKQRR